MSKNVIRSASLRKLQTSVLDREALIDSFDTNNDGKFSRDEVAVIVDHLLQMKAERKVWRNSFVGLCGVMVILLGIMVAAVVVGNEATKETIVRNGKLQTRHGGHATVSTLAASTQMGITIHELEGADASLVALGVDQDLSDTTDTSRVVCGALAREAFFDAEQTVRISSQTGVANYKALGGKMTRFYAYEVVEILELDNGSKEMEVHVRFSPTDYRRYGATCDPDPGDSTCDVWMVTKLTEVQQRSLAGTRALYTDLHFSRSLRTKNNLDSILGSRRRRRRRVTDAALDPTPSPAASPTASPSDVPTRFPSGYPTLPTGRPSKPPTPYPTSHPTLRDR